MHNEAQIKPFLLTFPSHLDFSREKSKSSVTNRLSNEDFCQMNNSIPFCLLNVFLSIFILHKDTKVKFNFAKEKFFVSEWQNN